MVAEIALENVSAAYGRRPALSGVRLCVGMGEMVGVIGPNGSGKSTLLKVIAGLLRPSEGRVYVGGRALSELSRSDLGRRLSLLVQSPVCPPETSVRELVGFGRYPHVRWPMRFGVRDREVVDSAIEACGLSGLAERRLSTLSGGEVRRAWVAMSLAQEPQVMLLDEPVTFLDVGHQMEVMELISDLNERRGLTVLAVLHDLNLAARYCTRLIALSRGRIHSDAPAPEVMRPDVLREVFGIGAVVGLDPRTHRPVCYPYRLDGRAGP